MNVDGSLTIDVPTNTLATIINAQGTANLYSPSLKVQYSGYPQFDSGEVLSWFNLVVLNTPILGPATITYEQRSDAATNIFVTVLLKFEAVNTTPAIAGFAVQPAHNSATIVPETSTNLTTWSPAVNGTYGTTNFALFFRMNLSVSP